MSRTKGTHIAGPKGRHMFALVKVGEKGQIVIPVEARRIFDIKAGDTLLVLGDEKQGLALVPGNKAMEIFAKITGAYENAQEDDNGSDQD